MHEQFEPSAWYSMILTTPLSAVSTLPAKSASNATAGLPSGLTGDEARRRLAEPGLAGIVAAVKEGRVIFQRILTYTLNSITKKTVQVLFLAVGLVMSGQAILTPLLMVLIMITGDFLGMSLTTDNMRPSPTPNAFGAWRMGSTSGLCGRWPLSASCSATRRRPTPIAPRLWSSHPAPGSSCHPLPMSSSPRRWLSAVSAMTPLPAWVVAGTLAAAAVFAVVLELVKVPVFARLRIA